MLPFALGALVFSLGCGSTETSPHGSGADAGTTPLGCAPLAPPTGAVIEVGPQDNLALAVQSAPAGATVLLADGTYAVGADGLWFGADGVTLRGASGDREAVVLDGSYAQSSGGVVNVQGRSGVTIAHLTIRHSRYHTVHITGGPNGKSDAVRLYDLHLLDPGEQAVKINANYGNDCDDGELACSLIELSDAGRERVMSYESSGMRCYTGGIDAHRGRGWVVRDNVVRGFWCSNGYLSEHGIHFWQGARDTLVERNLLIDNARAIGFGLGARARLVESMASSFEYALHELPAGVLYGLNGATTAECDELLLELEEFEGHLAILKLRDPYADLIAVCRLHFRSYREYLALGRPDGSYERFLESKGNSNA